jgi:hypothetical protein
MATKKDKYLSVLLAVLICLIVAASIVIAKMPKGQKVKYYDTTPKYDENIVRLGVSASKFGGMAVYMDSPAVLLAQADKLGLTDDQKRRLRSLVDAARTEAASILTAEQLEEISPIPTEPVVLAKLEREYLTCEDCMVPEGTFGGGNTAAHDHGYDHSHDHDHARDHNHDH